MVGKTPRGLGKGLGALIPTGPALVEASAPSATAILLAPDPAAPHPAGPKPVAGAYFLEIPDGDL
ncbi:hypothetical protein AB0P04_44175, partial [Streptomyces anulatus]